MKIRRIQLGVTGTYLVACDDGGYIMIDAGEPGLAAKFKRTISRWRIEPHAIRLLIITHAHYDHVGSLAEIKRYCGCPVLIHPEEEEILQQARVVIPPGTSRLGSAMSRVGTLLRPFMRFPATKGDILVAERYDLSIYGLAGEVLPTPGHTPGSLSVVLASGEALVGDLAMNFLFHSTFPIFAENAEQVKESRTAVKGLGVHTIYPAHGKAFPVAHLK